MSSPEIYPPLTEIFRDILNRPDLVLSPTLVAEAVPEWDSFNHINILVATEAAFGVKFNTREIELLATVGDLVDLIALKQKQAA